MPRKPSTILTAAEAKVVDLDKEIKVAEKDLAKVQKTVDSLYAKREAAFVKATTPKKPRAKKAEPMPIWVNPTHDHVNPDGSEMEPTRVAIP